MLRPGPLNSHTHSLGVRGHGPEQGSLAQTPGQGPPLPDTCPALLVQPSKDCVWVTKGTPGMMVLEIPLHVWPALLTSEFAGNQVQVHTLDWFIVMEIP